MDYKVLYRKYRPNDFSSIIGQDYMVTILKNALKQNKISHAYIFSGPRGTGKTSTAKVFAKALNCLNPTENGPCNECETCIHFKENADIIEIDAASNNGVDEIREIINNIKLAPAYSKYKVYIIDEVHMLSTSAFNALLLTLEEPPKHVVFILATTNIEAVPITILSRTQRFDFHKISLPNIISQLRHVVENENIAIDDDALEEIAYISDGGMRDALSILDQLSSNSSKITISEVTAHFGSVSKKQISDLYETILKNDVENFVNMMQKFKELAIDYKLLIKKILEKIEEEAITCKKEPNYQGLNYQNLKNMAFELADISNYVNLNIDPYVLIEITLLKYFNNQEQKEIPKKEQSPEPKDELPPKMVVNPPKPTVINLENTELIKIRVNNCFVNAKKEYLQTIKTTWPDFLKIIDNKNLINLLLDTTIVAASDKVTILSNLSESTVNLINNNLTEIENLYQKNYHQEYKFIALTEETWQKEKEIYITNIKNKISYTYQDEPATKKEEPSPPEEIPNIEKTAFELFDKSKIEFE